jgi:hypothetical protein
VPGRFAQLGLVPLIAALLLDVLALSVDLIRNGRLRSGLGMAEIGLDFSSSLSQASNAAVGISLLVAVVTFLIWFSNAYRRLSARGRARYAPRWALLGWFVPGLNALRPPEMMDELVSARDRHPNAHRPGTQLPDSQTASGQTSSQTVLAAWWGLWILGAFIIVALRFLAPTTLEGWAWWFRFAIGADVALICSLVCALVLIERAD